MQEFLLGVNLEVGLLGSDFCVFYSHDNAKLSSRVAGKFLLHQQFVRGHVDALPLHNSCNQNSYFLPLRCGPDLHFPNH